LDERGDMNQQHLTDDDMILHFYNEPDGDPGAGDHVRDCAECQARLQSLRRLLNSVDTIPVPERGELYGKEVWNKIRKRLDPNKPVVVTMARWKTWAAVAAMFVVGVSGYFIGRNSSVAPIKGRGGPVTVANENFESGRQRVLLVALTDHFERSQMVLAELSNAEPGQAGKLDIRYEREEASELLDSNRLYRQAALQQGDTQAAVLLEDLERTLLEVAHSPDNVGQNEFEELRRRIEDQGLVFKVKVLSTRLQRQGSPAAAGTENTKRGNKL
jgi:hypothetical protein